MCCEMGDGQELESTNITLSVVESKGAGDKDLKTATANHAREIHHTWYNMRVA